MSEPNLKSITASLMVKDVDQTAEYYHNILDFDIKMSVSRDDGSCNGPWSAAIK